MRIACCCAIISALVFPTYAQPVLPDSIRVQYGNMVKDSSYVNTLNKLASEYLKTNAPAARIVANHTSDLARRINFRRGYARALTVIGNSYWYEGVYEFAQNYYLLAARQYQAIEDFTGLGQVYNNIGEVNKKLGNKERALHYLIRSVSMREQDTTLALTLYNIGELYLSERNFDEAKKYIYQSFALAEKNRDERSLAYNNWSIGNIKAAEESLGTAMPYYEKALDGWMKLGETRALIQTYQDIGLAHLSAKDTKKAEWYINEASNWARRINARDLNVTTQLLYAKIDSTRGDYGMALQHLFRHNELRDSVYNLSKAEQIARLQTLYETERIDRENEQLRAEKQRRIEQLKSREGLIAAITTSLLVLALLTTVLFQQRRRILRNNKLLQGKNAEINFQKEAIETQAVALLKLNDELKHLNKTLESRIEERSKQLLIQNQKLAEYSFVNAHKLRAPVASILGLINLLNFVGPGERDIVLSHLQTCARQLDAIIFEISRNLESEE
jgi:tetratricopeptide (TPR) repeat protein